MKFLYPYQVRGAEFLASRQTALLYDDPGLGKSAQAIASFPMRGCRAVVVCPLSVKSVWEREVRQWRPDLMTSVLSGRNSFRAPVDDEVVIINWDVLPASAPAFRPGTVLIGDEQQYAKSTTAARSQHFRRLASAVLAADGRVVGLTGTPLWSWPSDLFGVHHSLHLDEKIWGSYRNFFYLFRGYQTQYGVKWGQPRGDVADMMKAWCLGRKRETVLPELPVKTFTRIDVKTRNIKEKVSDQELMTDFDRGATGANLSKARAALALAKAESGQVQDLLRMWAEESPLVVFSAHREASKAVAHMFETDSYDGSTLSHVRTRLEAEFSAGKTPVIVGTIGAMGVGLTLTRSHRVVFLDRAWTPSENKQAEDRVCRIGQTRGVQVVDLVSADNKLDDSVFKLLRAKTKILDASVEASRGE